MGIEDKQIETIIEAHSETVNGLKAQRDKAQEEAKRVPDLQRKLEEAKQAAKDDSDWHKKYDEEHKSFEEYKTKVESAESAAKLAKAYRTQVLAKANIGQQFLDDVMGVTKLDGIEMDDDGNIKDAEELATKAKEKWASFVVKQETKGSNPENPPKGKNIPEGADPDVAKRMAERNARMYGATETKE